MASQDLYLNAYIRINIWYQQFDHKAPIRCVRSERVQLYLAFGVVRYGYRKP